MGKIARNCAKLQGSGQVKSTLKPIEKSLETHWKPIGNSLETCWKLVENPLETIENCWKPFGNPLENHWKPVENPIRKPMKTSWTPLKTCLNPIENLSKNR